MERLDTSVRPGRRDWLIPWTGYAVLCGVQIWSLGHSAMPLSDEGVYLYAAKLMADGHVPYRDFLLVHPLGAIWPIALLFKLFGVHLVALRAVYVLLAHAIMFPIHGLIRRESSGMWPTVCGLAAYIGYSQIQLHDSRFLALRIVALVPIAYGLWLGIEAKRPFGRFVAGLLLAYACCITLSAAFVVAPLLIGLGVATWKRDRRGFWLWSIGVTVGAIPLAAMLMIPNAWDALIGFHGARDRASWALRWQLLKLIILIMPITFIAGMAGSVLGDGRVTRLAGAANVVGLVAIFAVPASAFVHYYNLLAVTLSISSGILVFSIKRPSVRAAAVTLMLVVCLGYQFGWQAVPYYFPLDRHRYQGYRALVDALRGCEGPLLTVEPIYALDSGHSIPFHYFAADFRALHEIRFNLPLSDFGGLLDASHVVLREKHAAERFPLAVWPMVHQSFKLSFQNEWGEIFVRR